MPGRMRGGPTEIAGVQLMQNEAVLEDVNPAWSAYVGSLLFGTLLLLGALAEATIVDSQNDAGAAAVMGVVVFGVIFGYAAYRRYRTHYIVTDSRVIKRTGIFLNSNTEEAGYEMITGVGVDASRFQSLFGNGAVKVATSGGVGTIELAGAPGAQDLANLIRERHPTLGTRGRGGPAGGPAPGGQPQGRNAPPGGRGQPRGGQQQGRGGGQNPQGGARQRGGRRQGGQPRDVDGARGAEGPKQRGDQPTNRPRQGGQRDGQPQGREGPSKRERRQQRADDERRTEQGRRDERRGETGRTDRTRSGRADAGRDRRGERTPEGDGPADSTPSSGGDPVGEDAGGRRSAGGERGDDVAGQSADERRRRAADDEDGDDEDGQGWDPDGR